MYVCACVRARACVRACVDSWYVTAASRTDWRRVVSTPTPEISEVERLICTVCARDFPGQAT